VASIAWFDKQFSKEITKDKKDLALSHDGLFHTLLGLFDVLSFFPFGQCAVSPSLIYEF
jgi:glucan phosphoethanolaminetransferase (alkaline phosphatase superfamily)